MNTEFERARSSDLRIRITDALPALSVIVTGSVLLGLARFFPFAALPPLCLFRKLSGIPCPACGMTRSWVLMSHADFGAALAMNPLGAVFFVALLLAVLGNLLALFGVVAAPPSPSDRLTRRFLIGLGSIWALNWAYVVWSGWALA